MKSNLFPIAQEGWKHLLVLSALSLLSFFFNFYFLSILLFFLTLSLLFIFRNPERKLSNFDSSSLLSPCDGIVKKITPLNDEKYAYRIDIESKLTNVSILRISTDGTINSIKKFQGTHVSKTSKLFEVLNEYTVITFSDLNNNHYKILHKTQQSFFPISIHSFNNEKIKQTSRYGFMNNGITSLYLPNNFRVNVNITNEVKASESLIGHFSS